MIGKTISHYRILEKLGEGGMGVVYGAKDSKLGREVALKFLPAEWTRDAEARARFLHEAQAAAALNHPNICTIYEIDEADGRIFIAMERIEGESLRDVIARGPLKIGDVLDVAARIAEGLALAHDRGIVHRDIKPGNVMLTPEGRPKIMDFGLAKSVGQTKLTRTGTTTGTVAYMSPEQSRGEDVDHRTDIWSFGAMLYEMLTGRRPFRGDRDQAVIHSILNDEPDPITGLRTGVPIELERIVVKTMAKRADERYQHVDDLLVDLRNVQKEMSARSPTTTSLRRPGEPDAGSAWRGLKPVVLVTAAVAVGLAGIAFYVTVVRDRPTATEPAGPERVLVATFDNRTGDPSLDHIGHTAATNISEGVAQTGVVEIVTHVAEEPAAGGAGQDMAAGSRLLADAREAGASILVAGSFSVRSDSLHIEARLLDVHDGTVLNVISDEAGPLATPAAAIAKARSRVMGALAAEADPTIGQEARLHAPTYEAYQEYATGLGLVGTETTRALEHLECAAEQDPAFASAQMWRAGALLVLGRFAEGDSLVQYVLSRPRYLTPHMKCLVGALQARFQGNNEGALRKLREFLREEPEHWWGRRWLGATASRLNRPREAIEVLSPLLGQDPQSGAYVETWTYSNLSSCYHMLGEFERELEITREAIAIYPDMLWLRGYEARALAALGRVDEVNRIIEESASTPGGHGSVWGILITAVDELRAHGHPQDADALAEDALEWQRDRMAIDGDTHESRRRLARALFGAGHWEEARALYEEFALADPDNLDNQGYLGVLAARMGDRAKALDIKKALLARDVPYEFGWDTYWAACIAAQLGDRGEAIDLLRRAFAEGAGIGQLAHKDPDLEPLWSYPPFQRLLEPRG